MKYIKLYEEMLDGWNYRITAEDQFKIKKYFQEKYPTKVNILNKTGYINPITLDITLKFAIKRKDEKLINMLRNLKNKYEEIETYILSKKFNI